MAYHSDGFPSPNWSEAFGELPYRFLSRPLRLQLLCGGLGAAEHFLDQLGIPFLAAPYVDNARWLAPALQDRGTMLFTDLLDIDVTSLPDCDGIISGPPCPPFSAIGKRKLHQDERYMVFKRVTDSIVHQGHGSALFFVLEQVMGFCHVPQGQASSPLDSWLADLQARAPMWQVHVNYMNSADYLPQHRPRVYVVGLNRRKGCSGLISIPRLPGRSLLTLESFLHSGLRAIDERGLTPQQRLNLLLAKRRLQPLKLLVVSADRNPQREFGEYIREDGLLVTLRTGNDPVWLLKTDASGSLQLSRRLHPYERFSLQGFPPVVATGLSRQQQLCAAGNAMTVPVVGAVCLGILQNLHSSGLIFCHGVPRSLQERFERHSRLAEISRLRREIAILDGLAEEIEA